MHLYWQCDVMLIISVTACDTDKPCGQHGDCVKVDYSKYTCKCNYGFKGDNCEIPPPHRLYY